MICPKCHSDNPGDTKFCGHCAAPLPGPAGPAPSLTKTIALSGEGLAPGLTFAGRYHILEEIGEGGMGRVYQALDIELQEKVALKVIKARVAADEKTVQRFRNELKLARRIIHKNVCRMYDLNVSAGVYYITMEYVSGENLKASLRRVGPLSVTKALLIAEQICAGLEEAHRLGFIHRDLKPQNIMIDREGVVRIMDFGIARDLAAAGLTDDGQMVGTLEYMSPEQLEGKKADPRSDLYSVGVILYEMVTGQTPFEGETPISVAAKHITSEPVDPRVLNDRVPDALGRIIMKCLEKDPDRRYQTAEELGNAVRDVRDSREPTVPLAVPRPERQTAGRAGRGKRAVLLLIIPAVLAAAGAVYYFVLRPPAPVPGKQAAGASPLKKEAAGPEATAPSAVPQMPSVPAASELKPPETKPAETKPAETRPPEVKPPEATPTETKPPATKAVEAAPAAGKAAPSAPAPAKPAGGAMSPKPGENLSALLDAARRAFQGGQLAACLEGLKPVLAADPRNADALELQAMAETGMAPQQLRDIVADYVRAFDANAIAPFYRGNASPEVVKSAESDVDLISRLYERFNAAISKVDVRIQDSRRADLSFACISTATTRADGRRHVLFDGTYRWSLERRGGRWTITQISATPAGVKRP